MSVARRMTRARPAPASYAPARSGVARAMAAPLAPPPSARAVGASGAAGGANGFGSAGEAGSLGVAAPSFVVLALAALSAAYLGLAAFFSAESLVEKADPTALAVAGGIVAAALILARVGLRGGLWIVLLGTFALQLNWSGWVNPQPIGDLAALWDQARIAAEGVRTGAVDWSLLMESRAPSALGFYAVVIAVVGDDLSVLRVICAALWTLQTWFVWRIARLVNEARGVAALAAALFGLAPAVAVFGALPSVEAVFGVFALGAVYVLISYRRRGLVRSAALSGVLVGLAILARPVGFGHLIALTLLMILSLGYLATWRQRGRMAQAIVGFWMGAALALAPAVALTAAETGRAALPTGMAVGYELYVGTDPRSGGAYREAVTPGSLATIGYGGPRALPPIEAESAAFQAAVARLTSDPASFAAVAIVEKTRLLWREHAGLLTWSVTAPSDRRAALENSGLGRAAPAILDGGLLALLALGALGAVRIVLRAGAVQDPTRWILLFATLLSVAAVIGVLEAQDRNTLVLLPFVALLAPMATARLPALTLQPRSAHGRASAEEGGDRAVTAPEDLGERAAAAFERADIRPPELAAPKVAADTPVEQRLARALAGMSKPTRRDDSDDDSR